MNGTNGYQEWIGSKCCEATARVYTSLIRNFFRSRELTLELLADPNLLIKRALDQDELIPSGTRRMFRPAIRSFMRFVAEQTGAPTIEIPFRDRRGTNNGKPPHPLAGLLPGLTFGNPDLQRRVPLEVLQRNFWHHMRRLDAGVTLEDTVSGRLHERIPLEAVQTLNLWAGAGKPANRDQPIIPEEPGSFFPMPLPRLLRVARR